MPFSRGWRPSIAFARLVIPPPWSIACGPWYDPARDVTSLMSFDAEKSKRRNGSVKDLYAAVLVLGMPVTNERRKSSKPDEKGVCVGLRAGEAGGAEASCGKSCTQIEFSVFFHALTSIVEV